MRTNLLLSAADKDKKHHPDTAIAIIGMACKFPGANNVNEFWNILKNGQATVNYLTVEQLRKAGVAEELLNHPAYVPYRGILSEVALFDPQLFNFSAEDIQCLNVQARTLLQLTWQALEDAGIAPKACPKQMSVFTGTNDSTLDNYAENSSSLMASIKGIKQLHFSKSLATLIAYQFGLQGTAVDLHTACSTSLVALVKACQDLILRNSDYAIVGGVAIEMPQEFGYLYEEGSIFSVDGCCRTFDARASGSVLSNGAGVIILKRLADAIADKDNIHAVILGHATNNDGNLKTGFLAPGINGQYMCIKAAWENAGVDPSMINYLEAHGSATLIGDPIEFFALKKAFQNYDLKERQCGIGSVKSNIGHTTIASGIAAVIKTALILKNRAIVPSLHFESINPNIELKNSPFYIADTYKKFPKKQTTIVAGVSNFGLGGTNAHVILQNITFKLPKKELGRKYQIMTLSAMNKVSLAKLIKHYIEFFTAEKTMLAKAMLVNACFTANCGRSHLQYRTHIVFTSYQSLLTEINNIKIDNIEVIKKQKVIFIFPQHKSACRKFAASLYKEEPGFVKYVNECLNKLTPSNKVAVSNILLNKKAVENKHISSLAFFIIEYALAKYLQTLNIVPAALLASGLSEFVAATLAGIFELTSVLDLLQSLNFSLKSEYSKEDMQKFQKLLLKKAEIPFISGSTGEWIDEKQIAAPDYWYSQLGNANLFAKGLATAMQLGEAIFLEIGSDVALYQYFTKQKLHADQLPVVIKISDSLSLVQALGQLWNYGVNVNWNKYYEPEQKRKISLPVYCFSNTSCNQHVDT